MGLSASSGAGPASQTPRDKGLKPLPPLRQSRPHDAYPGRFPLPSILSVSGAEYGGKGGGCRGGGVEIQLSHTQILRLILILAKYESMRS